MELYSFDNKWGSFGNGNGQFNAPWDVAIGLHGKVFVADANNNRIQKFDEKGQFELTIGEPRMPSFAIVDDELLTPVGIFVDNDRDEIYATDDHRRVLVFDLNGNFIRNWQDSNLGGRGIVMDPINKDSIFVANYSLSCIEVYDLKGNKKFKWGQQGNGNNQFNRPNSIAFDSQGFLYVADTENHRIMKFTCYGAYVHQWGNFGKRKNEFIYPLGISTDPNNNVFVTDGTGKIKKFDSDGNFITSFGKLGMADGQFNVPSGIDTQNGKYIYIADRYNQRIQIFSLQ